MSFKPIDHADEELKGILNENGYEGSENGYEESENEKARTKNPIIKEMLRKRKLLERCKPPLNCRNFPPPPPPPSAIAIAAAATGGKRKKSKNNRKYKNKNRKRRQTKRINKRNKKV